MKPLVLRSEDPPPAGSALVRAGERGLDHDLLRRTATRTHAEFGYYGVSVYIALDGSVDELCGSVPALGRYGQIRLSVVRRLREASFALLPTGPRPHFSIVLPDLEDPTLERLGACFDEPLPNPAKG